MKWALVVVVVEVRKEEVVARSLLKIRVEIENYPSEDEEEDSSLETSFELNVDPQQLASVGLDRPLLRLRLTPRRRVTAAAPGGGGTPPPLGEGTETVPLQERQNGTGYITC